MTHADSSSGGGGGDGRVGRSPESPGRRARPRGAQDRVDERYQVYRPALAAIEQRVDVEARSRSAARALVYGSIDGMLRTLDPHSSFFSIRGDFAQMRERQVGRYFGIGITILSIDGDDRGDARSSRGRRPTGRASAAATSSRASERKSEAEGRPGRRPKTSSIA